MLGRIENRLDQLSRTERKVAEWVLEHPRQAAEATLREVADAAGTSEPTVVRFCRKVGLGGFRELTLRLTEAMSRPVSYLHSDVKAGDSTSDATLKVLDASITSLVELRGELSAMPVDEAVHVLSRARQIVFAGLGASGHVARDACHKFFRLGTPCSAFTDIPGLMQFGAIAGPGDVLVISSHTGSWRELVSAAGGAARGGAVVIALTDPDSPLAQAANVVLPCRIIEDTSVYTPMSSRLAHLALLDALYIALALRLGPDAFDRLRETKEALSGLTRKIHEGQDLKSSA